MSSSRPEVSDPRAYATNALSIAIAMAKYASRGHTRGLRNGVRALATLAREVVSAVLRDGPSARECPICGWSGPRFGPVYFVDEYRTDTLCYRCRSTDRNRTAKLFVEVRLKDFFREERRRVLDIGPVPWSRAIFPEDVDYVSFDLVSDLAMVKGDISAAPFSSGSFDAWLCFHVLDIVADDGAAMRELFRVLKPGGVGLLDNVMNWSGPTVEYEASRPDESDHRRRYGTDLPDRLRAVGFRVEVVDSMELVDEETKLRCGIYPRRMLICFKDA